MRKIVFFVSEPKGFWGPTKTQVRKQAGKCKVLIVEFEIKPKQLDSEKMTDTEVTELAIKAAKNFEATVRKANQEMQDTVNNLEDKITAGQKSIFAEVVLENSPTLSLFFANR